MLRDLRQKAGLSQQKLAELSGVPRRTIQDWERLRVSPTVVDNLRRLAKVLDCTIDELIGDEHIDGR